jgi:hypothetical protein
LRPLKVRDLLPSFAMEMDRPVEEVQAVVAFYYKTLRQKLTSLETVNVQVENLGTFYIKERALHNQIDKLNNYTNKLSDTDIKQYEIKLQVARKIEMMKNMVELILEEKQRRRVVINKRFNNEPGS